jgi:BlaI family penicillinase repressor
MAKNDATALSRRERQIMDAVYQLGEASANSVRAGMCDPPSRTAVRTFLRILEEKGHLRHRQRGREYVYSPTQPRQAAGASAVRRVLRTFFEGSLEKAVAVHLSDPDATIDREELKRLEAMIREARKQGR